MARLFQGKPGIDVGTALTVAVGIAVGALLAGFLQRLLARREA